LDQVRASRGAQVADESALAGPADEPLQHTTGPSLAARLAEAHRRLAELELPGPEAARLHRQFIAVCDAVKAAGADEAAAKRRITAFMAALDQVERGGDRCI
jgi:hypothetical protein